MAARASAIREAREAARHLESAILWCETGPAREALTAANIILLEASSRLNGNPPRPLPGSGELLEDFLPAEKEQV
jgi:hypothetical protein